MYISPAIQDMIDAEIYEINRLVREKQEAGEFMVMVDSTPATTPYTENWDSPTISGDIVTIPGYSNGDSVRFQCSGTYPANIFPEREYTLQLISGDDYNLYYEDDLVSIGIGDPVEIRLVQSSEKFYRSWMEYYTYPDSDTYMFVVKEVIKYFRNHQFDIRQYDENGTFSWKVKWIGAKAKKSDGVWNIYQLWLNEGNHGDVEDFLLTLRGLPGLQGDTGNGIDITTYDDTTGILTITYTDGSSFSTADLRGTVSGLGDMAQYNRANAAQVKALDVNNLGITTQSLRLASVPFEDTSAGPTYAPNMSESYFQSLVLTDDCQIIAPINMIEGKEIVLTVWGDDPGNGRVITFDPIYQGLYLNYSVNVYSDFGKMYRITPVIGKPLGQSFIVKEESVSE